METISPQARKPKRAGTAWLVALVAAGAWTVQAPAASLPAGFSETVVATGLNAVTAMELAPDGRIFICEQTGALRVVKNDVLLPQPFVRLNVDSSWERGLLGVAFDPHFIDSHLVYVHYVAPSPYPHHRVSRLTAHGDLAAPNSEVILFEGDNQNNLGGGVKNGHQGGAIHSGKDGKLYIAIGDQTAGAPAQSLQTLQGKILRINPDGSLPADNPFYSITTGKYRAIWALGLRNPFCFAVQPGTGRMFINDVGGANEEINVGVRGANYGWPTADHGPTNDRRFRGPIYWYKESSITGGAFYNPPVVQFPADYVGRYFFADFKAGWIKTLEPDHPNRVRDFASAFGLWGVVDLKVAADGSLYYLSRNAWVRDHHFQPRTGTLTRVRYMGDRAPPRIVSAVPAQTVVAGDWVNFRVQAEGTPPLQFQWLRTDRAIAGAGSPDLLLRSVQADDGARFRCVVSNRFGQAISEPATLAVKRPFEAVVSESLGGIFVSPSPGRYTGAVTVCLQSVKPGVSIHFTTDGTEPNPASPCFSKPFELHRSATVKVLAVRNGLPDRAVVMAAFTIRGQRPYGLPYRENLTPLHVSLTPEQMPPLLSKTGLFASVRELRPNAGLVPYEVNAPLWSDGAQKRRWIALAPGGQIEFAPTGEWAFPAGTVFVKHFEVSVDAAHPEVKRRLETRLLRIDGTGLGYGVTYKWRPDNREADLLPDSQSETIEIRTSSGRRTQTWYYPSRADCLTCHTAAARFVLGVKTRQLNKDFCYPATGISDNQLRTWNYLGMFNPALAEEKIGGYSRLGSMEDRSASLTDRARSYLDANCAHCHRPGNTVRAMFDARFDVPLSRQDIVNRPTVSDSLGLNDPCLVAPGDLGRSMIYHRLCRTDHYRMPPLATSVPDLQALHLFERWIKRQAQGQE
jgi:uncharacterized repeat protein (TIGR03806 family)